MGAACAGFLWVDLGFVVAVVRVAGWGRLPFALRQHAHSNCADVSVQKNTTSTHVPPLRD